MNKQTIVDYVKNTPNNSNPAVLGSLLNQFEESAGSKLPEVTSEDEGKVLKVVDGEWNKGESSESPFVRLYDDGTESDKYYPENVQDLNRLFDGKAIFIELGKMIDDIFYVHDCLTCAGETIYPIFWFNKTENTLTVVQFKWIEDDDENYIGIEFDYKKAFELDERVI